MKYGTMKPENYIPRIADARLQDLLQTMGAVEVTGTMWCGKTWTSLAFGNSLMSIGRTAGRTAAEADPETALIGDHPHVIDEWQDVPAIWDEVRASVDMNGEGPGQYILTGSSEPDQSRVSHSGAGRIGKVRMHTMTLAETGESNGSVSLRNLFEGKFKPVLVHQKLQPLAEIICRGGWPAIIDGKQRNTAYLLDSYFDALFDVNIPRRGLDGTECRRVAASLARNTGHAATRSTIAQDAGFTEGSAKTINARVSSYISALENLFVIDRITGWDAPIRSKSRLRTKPKNYFADPSMAASLLQITPERLVTDGQLFGMLFENQCVHDLMVYAAALPDAESSPIHYYRDSDGLEVDVIIELRSGRWAGIEIKLGENKWKEGANTLNRLRRKVAANPAARNPAPDFMAVLTGAGELARYDKENDVYIVPLTTLGP